MKTFTIIAGVNGVGKSNFTGVLQAERKDLGTLIDVDKLAVKFKNPIAGAREGIKIMISVLKLAIHKRRKLLFLALE